MNKKNSNAAAVIEIGTDNVRMRVSQMSKGKLSPLDLLEYPVRLGHDVFETGSISFDSLRELSSVLGKYSSALLTYGVQKPKVVSCTALRNAANRALVIDQLRVRNELDVTVLEDSQEKAYLYWEILSRLETAGLLREGNSVVAYVGTGTIGVAVFDGTKIVDFQNISMGALKLHEILQGMHRFSEDFHTVVEEYLDTILNRVLFSGLSVDNLILTGSQMDLVAKQCGAKSTSDVYQFSVRNLTELYRSLRSMTPESIGLRYGIGEEQAAVFYSALSIYQSMLRFCPKAEIVYAPKTDLSNAIARCMLAPKAETDRTAFFRKSTIACAEASAHRFCCDPVHIQYIRDCSCKIFDKLKKVHGLDPSKRLILELAAILHSCGSFVNVRQHNECTVDLIKGMDLFGLSESEVLEVALVAGSISSGVSGDDDLEFARLSAKEKLVVSKLAAMFRMANALDKSHRGKLREIKVSIEDDRVLFKASADRDTLLEQWAFAESAPFFQDVFGLSPELSIKFELI